MKSDISEFSYGYALTEHMIRWQGTMLTGAPIFPNLYEEGQWGSGYDVKFDRPGIPLFLQFKLSNYIKSRNAKEFAPDSTRIPLDVPFFRMKLRPTCYSNQHPSLLNLEADGNEVYYAGPAFHLQAELNDAYLTRAVVERSVFFRPRDIGPLPDSWKHHIAFDPAQDAQFGYLYSEPKKVPILKPGSFAESVSVALEERGAQGLGNTYLAHLKQQITEAVGDVATPALEIIQELPGYGSIAPAFSEWAENLWNLRSVAYLARTFLDCQLIVVQHKESK